MLAFTVGADLFSFSVWRQIPKNRKVLFVILWILRLDYAYCQLTDTAAMQKTAEHRKQVFLFVQTIPCTFITVHSLFVDNVTHLMPQISLAFSILDMAYANSAYIAQNNGKEFHFTFKDIMTLSGYTCYLSVENLLKLIFWGFFAMLTQPVGIWILFFAPLYMFTYFTNDKFTDDFIKREYGVTTEVDIILVRKEIEEEVGGNLLSCVFIGRIVDPFEQRTPHERIIAKAVTKMKVFELSVFCITLLLWHKSFSIMLQEEIWQIYFIAGCCCFFLFFIMNFFVSRGSSKIGIR